MNLTKDQWIRIFTILTFITAALIICLSLSKKATADTRLYVPNPVFHGYDKTTGLPLSGGLLYSYQANSSATKELYTSRTGGTVHANPVVLGSAGEKIIYGSGTYKLILKDRNKVTQWTMDYVMFPQITDFAVTLLDDANAAAARSTLGLGNSATYTVGTSANQLISLDANTKLPAVDGSQLTGVAKLSDAHHLARSYLAGLQMSNAAGDSDHDIVIAVGECRDVNNATDIALATASFTKQIDVGWAVGSAAGGLESDAVLTNNEWYYIYIIMQPSTGATDALISDDSGTPDNLPATYTVYRRIGCIQTDGSANVRGFDQWGDEFMFDTPRADVSGVAIDAVTTVVLNDVPLGIAMNVHMNVIAQDGGNRPRIYIFPTHVTDATPQITSVGAVSSGVGATITSDGYTIAAGKVTVKTDTSASVKMHAWAGGNGTDDIDELWVYILGWVDRRGRDS